MVGFIAAILIAVYGALINNILSQHNNFALGQLGQQKALGIARSLDSYLNSQVESLKRLSLNPSVIELLENNPNPELIQRPQDLLSAFAAASDLRLISLGEHGVTATNFPYKMLSPIEIDWIIKTSQGQSSKPEVYKKDGNNSVGLIAAVRNDNEQVVGAIILNLKTNAVLRLINSLAKNDGNTQLVQSFGSYKSAFADLGSGLSSAPQAKVQLTSAKGWHVLFTPGNALGAMSAVDTQLNLLLSSLGAVLLLSVTLLLVVGMHRRLKGDLNEVNMWMTKAQGEGLIASYRVFKFDHIKHVTELMRVRMAKEIEAAQQPIVQASTTEEPDKQSKSADIPDLDLDLDL